MQFAENVLPNKFLDKQSNKIVLVFPSAVLKQLLRTAVCDVYSNRGVCFFSVRLQAMVGILQGKARGGEEESVLMHDLKPFRILISLLDKPELGKTQTATTYVLKCAIMATCHTVSLFSSSSHLYVSTPRPCNPGGCPHRGVPNFAHAVSNRVGPSKPESIQ